MGGEIRDFIRFNKGFIYDKIIVKLQFNNYLERYKYAVRALLHRSI